VNEQVKGSFSSRKVRTVDSGDGERDTGERESGKNRSEKVCSFRDQLWVETR